ncbi:MAG: electron transfer flavoprotein subunit beta/FixA family protein [Bacteroidota bacterium]|nr:electron transfer flavoprotein subunit beta/FixA family protein [Bacteroidota bacterium]
MKILVCITHVPDTTSKINFKDNNTKFDTTGVQFIIGPYDDYALARAVELKDSTGSTLTVLNVGLADTEPTIRKALAIGADDAIRVNAEPTDSFFVAAQIAEQAKAGEYDLILMGRESIDYNSGVVHGLVGEMLGIPSVSPVMKLDIDGTKAKVTREIEGGKELLEIDIPFVAGCQEPIAEWKIPNMRGIMSARTKPLKVVEAKSVDSGVKLQKFELPPAKGAVKMIAADNVAELVKLLKTEAKVL